MTGLHLAHYRIESELGRGGMGIVYRAHDTKLDRTVALKVLPPHALASEEDRARFYREARAAARLSHAHICHVYQVDEAPLLESGAASAAGAEMRPYIAMEFVDGSSLAALVSTGPLRLSEIIRIATQVGAALGTAHDAGVVHRDVKSGNVMLTAKGEVKVLDFGLAKTAASTQLTRQGSTLGTIAYMSPEQARGEEVDHRTDLWALGVVLYEMIAGRLPFLADYDQATLYGILNEDPEPLTSLRTGVPMQLEWIVSKLLSKRPAERYQSTDDLLVDLAAVDLSGSGAGQSSSRRLSVGALAPQPSQRRGGPEKRSGWRWAAWGLLAGILLASMTWYGIFGMSRPRATAVRSQLALPPGVSYDPGRSAPLWSENLGLAVSRDGRHVAFVGTYGGTTSIYAKTLSDADFRRIPGTEGAYGVFFSPDGGRIAFFSGKRLKIVQDIDRGSVRDVASVSLPYGGVWLTDRDAILFANHDGSSLVRVDLSDDSVHDEVFVIERNGREVDAPIFVPTWQQEDGRILAERSDGWYLLDLETRRAVQVGNFFVSPVTLPGGVLIERVGVGLSIGPVESGAFRFGGRPVQLVDSMYSRFGDSHFAGSPAGTVVVARGPDLDRKHLAWVDRNGSIERLPFPAADLRTFSLSPDGRNLAIAVAGIDAVDLWLYDVERGTTRKLTSDAWVDMPVWAADNRTIYAVRHGAGGSSLVRLSSDASSAAETVMEGVFVPVFATRDDRYVGVLYDPPTSLTDIGYIDLEDPSTVLPIATDSTATEVLARLSGAGDFLAYTSSVTGDYEIYVQPFPPDGRVWSVTTGGGEEPVWGADDRVLYYRYGDRLYVVDVTLTGKTPAFSAPRLILDRPFENVSGHSIDVSPIDGRVLVLLGEEEKPVIRTLELITNAPALLEEH